MCRVVEGGEIILADSGSSHHVVHDARFVNNRHPPAPGYEHVTIGDGKRYPVTCYGCVDFIFHSNTDVRVTMEDVAVVPGLDFNLFSLHAVQEKCPIMLDHQGVHVGSGELFFPRGRVGSQLYATRVPGGDGASRGPGEDGSRTGGGSSSLATAVLAPGKQHVPADGIDINAAHVSFGHAHEAALRATCRQMGLKCSGVLLPCEGCSRAKGIGKAVPRSTAPRAVRPLQYVATDLAGPHSFRSYGGAQYTMLVTDMFSGFSWIYFLKEKHEAACHFSMFLTDVSWYPGRVEVVRTDNGGEFVGEEFRRLCVTNGIRMETTTPGTPQQNGIVERRLAMRAEAAQAAFIEASRLFPNAGYPGNIEKMWAEARFWANDALNRVASSSNPGHKSPYEMFYGFAPPFVLLPFLTPGFAKVLHRETKADEKAQLAFFLNKGSNHARDAYKLLLPNGRIIYSASVTWWHPRAPWAAPAGGNRLVQSPPPQPPQLSQQWIEVTVEQQQPQQQQAVPLPSPSQSAPPPPPPSPPSSSPPPPAPLPRPAPIVHRQLQNFNKGPRDHEEFQPGRTRAASRAMTSAVCRAMAARRGIVEEMTEQRPPGDPAPELPSCKASELKAPANFKEVCASPEAAIWNAAIMKEFEGLKDAGTFGEIF